MTKKISINEFGQTAEELLGTLMKESLAKENPNYNKNMSLTCGDCGNTMLVGINVVLNKDGDPICSTCVGKLVRKQSRKKKVQIVPAVLLVLTLLNPMGAWAQAPGEKVAASPLIGWLGVTIGLAGGALMVPWSEGENYKVNGTTYCYSQGRDYFNFERGACGVSEPTPAMIKTGIGMAVAGGVMALIGFRRVEFIPGITDNSASLTTRIKWGGKK